MKKSKTNATVGKPADPGAIDYTKLEDWQLERLELQMLSLIASCAYPGMEEEYRARLIAIRAARTSK